MADALDFEKPLLELENRIAELRADGGPHARGDEIARLEERLARLRQRTYASLTAWQRTQLARHPKRPRTLDYVRLLIEEFVELHGDRVFGGDKAVVGGSAGSMFSRRWCSATRRGVTRARTWPGTSGCRTRK